MEVKTFSFAEIPSPKLGETEKALSCHEVIVSGTIVVSSTLPFSLLAKWQKKVTNKHTFIKHRNFFLISS